MRNPNRLRVASYSPTDSKVAAIWGPEPGWFRLGIVDIKDETIRFIDLLW